MNTEIPQPTAGAEPWTKVTSNFFHLGFTMKSLKLTEDDGACGGGWLPPSDRHLALLAKLNVGWSNRAANGHTPNGPATNLTSPTLAGDSISADELAHIKGVMERVEKMEKREQERVGRLVEKADRMKRLSMGDGVNECRVCGTEFGVFDHPSYAAICYDCRKYACRKTCGIDGYDGEKRAIFVCKLCNEAREAWKKSGAWFYHGHPKYALSPRQEAPYGPDETEHSPNPAGPSLTHIRNTNSISPKPPRSSHSGEGPFDKSNYTHGQGGGASPAEYEDEYAPVTPKPRWAATSTENRRWRRDSETPRRTVSISHGYSSSEDEQEGHGRAVVNDDGYSDQEEQRKSEVENESVLGQHNHQDQNVMVKSVDSAAFHQIPSDPPQPTSRLSSPPKSVDSGPACTLQPPPMPTFVQHPQLNAGAVVAASRRASVAAVERLVEKMSVVAGASVGADRQRMSLACSPDVTGTMTSPLSPDLPSSPDDDQSSLGTLEFSVLYHSDAQTLTVSIIKAENLRARDKNGYSDPYVKLHLIPGAVKSTKLRTRTIPKTLNPEWNENLVYHGITDEERLKKTLRVLVLDEDRIGADFLGESRVQLKRVTAGKEKYFNVYLERRLPLEKNDNQAEGRGKILLSLCYDAQKLALIIEIMRCVELIGMDPNGYSDPYVKIALLPESDKKHKAKTKIKKKTLNPIYDETFVFPVSLQELINKTLEVAVWDRDVGKHDDYLGGVRFGAESKGDRYKHWNDVIQKPGTKCQKWHKLTDEN